METTRIDYQEYNLADENWEDDTLNKNMKYKDTTIEPINVY